MIRLLISDIDGTLVRSDKTLAPATIDAVTQLTGAGVPMSLISARPPSGMSWIADALGLRGPFGAFNGGTLFTSDGEITERHGLNEDTARAIVGLFEAAGTTCWVFADDGWYTNNAQEPHNPHEVKAANVQPIIVEDFTPLLARADKIVAVSDNHQLLIGMERDAIALVRGEATIARSQPYYLDVTAPMANKGDGIERIAAAFGVPLADVLVIGDQANDLPMFARAGASIAMGQASDDVKARARHATASNDEDGVAVAIDRLLAGTYGEVARHVTG